MQSSQRDTIANYLFQTFIEGNACPRPHQIRDNPDLHKIVRQYLDRRYFERQPPFNQNNTISQGVNFLTTVLRCSEIESESVMNELSLKLGAVFKGESQTLRPLLDILIEGGFYSDPDEGSTLLLTGKSMDVADAERAWKQEYQGTAHETLLQNIQTSFKKGIPYSNSGAIIQSSGYGKSRTVDQMATLIPTIPMNIRTKEDEEQGAFPPADGALVTIFDAMKKATNPVQTLFLFFKLLFELVHDLANDFKQDDFTAELYHYLKDHDRRAKLYTDLLGKMGQNPGKASSTEAIESFGKLAALFPENDEHVKMVIYVDEAHTLAPKIKSGASMYDHMLKATTALASAGVFFLFLSTASRLEVLASQSALSNSSRFQAAHNTLVAPFTEMPFDCHPSLVKNSIQPRLRLEEIQKFAFAVQFGRPLFWAYFEAMAAQPDVSKEEQQMDQDRQTATLAMAQGKLIANTSLSVSDNTGKLAILDMLLNLEYDPRRNHSHQLASTMVASHLRTVYSVPVSRAYMHTGYPSEPILAEAALTLANNMSQTTSLGPLLHLYRDLDAHADTAGAIDKGERGENVGKMILLLAYTAAVKKRSKSQPHKRLWGEGCSLVDFLTELTGEEFCDKVLVSVPDNLQGGTALKETFEKSWVRFTHFARAADDSAMTTSMAWVAFIRGMAMIGWHSQKDVDVSIPILLDKDKPIEEANMSVILVQFKVREERTSQAKVAIREDKIRCFPLPNSSRDAFANQDASKDVKRAYHTRPYISLVMELGLVAPFNSACIPSTVVRFLDNRGSRPPTSQKKHKPNASVSNVHILPPPIPRTRRTSPRQIHPRYSLFYYGCSHRVYRCIPDTSEAKEACRALLQIPTVFNDRQEDRPIDPILQMKPFWNAGPNCFSWVNEPYFKPMDQQNELGDDEVLTGNADDSIMDADADPDAMEVDM